MVKTLLSLLNRKTKLRMFAMVPFMLLAVLLDMFGLAMIFSVCSVMINQTGNIKSTSVIGLGYLFQSVPEQNLLSGMLTGLIILNIFRMVYLAGENYAVSRFVRSARFEVSKLVCNRIIRSGYPFFTRHNSAELQNLMGQDMYQFQSGINALLQLLQDIPVIAGFSIALFLINPIMTCFILGGMLLLILLNQAILRLPIKRTSEKQRKANNRRRKWLYQIVTGIKVIKTGNLESYFEENFNRAAENFAGCDTKKQFLLRLPPLITESIMVLAVLVYLLYMTSTGTDLIQVFPSLSALVWTALRMLPATGHINTSLTQLEYAKPSVKAIKSVIRETGIPDRKQTQPQPTTADNTFNLEMSGITFSYNERKGDVLKNVNMKIHNGESVGIGGETGAGKTTLLDILLGLLEPDQGKIIINGQNIQENSGHLFKELAYLPQETFLVDDTIRNNVAVGIKVESIDDRRVWDALLQAGLKELIQNLPDGLDTLIGENGIRLSGGERQRIGLARALYRNPSVIVLDEATSALDTATENSVLDSIFGLKGRKTLIIVSHRQSALKRCDSIYRLRDRELEPLKQKEG